jgi:hypothetical protein
MSNHLNQSPPSRRSKRDSTADFLVSILLVTTILATAGFGTLPDNPITTAFQTVIGQYVPEVWLKSHQRFSKPALCFDYSASACRNSQTDF